HPPPLPDRQRLSGHRNLDGRDDATVHAGRRPHRLSPAPLGPRSGRRSDRAGLPALPERTVGKLTVMQETIGDLISGAGDDNHPAVVVPGARTLTYGSLQNAVENAADRLTKL